MSTNLLEIKKSRWMYSCMYRFTSSKIMSAEIWTKLLCILIPESRSIERSLRVSLVLCYCCLFVVFFFVTVLCCGEGLGNYPASSGSSGSVTLANFPWVYFLGTALKFRKRKKLSSSLVNVLHKTWNWAFLRRSNAGTVKKCTKKRDARAKFFNFAKPVAFLAFSLPSPSLSS